MRAVSATLLAQIQSLHQTQANNANPMMRAIIVKANYDLNVYTLTSADILGPLDLAMQWEDLTAAPDALWVAQVINRQAVVSRYNWGEMMDFAAPDMTVMLVTVASGATVKDIAIEFDGNLTGADLETEGAPYIAWLERTPTHDKAYIIRWDGTGSQPTATEILSVTR